MWIYISLSYRYLADIAKQNRSLELTKDIGKASLNTVRLSCYGEFGQNFVLNTMIFKAYELSAGM